MRIVTRIGSRIIAICKLVPLLPVVIVAAVPLALLWDCRPWGSWPTAVWGWPVNPSLGQWIVVALVLYTVGDTLIGMIEDIRHGHVGVDVLAVVAILSTLAVREYWASWAVTLMIASGEAIEEYAQAKAGSSLTALLKAAPHIAHVVDLPGVGNEDGGKGVGKDGGIPDTRGADSQAFERRGDPMVPCADGVVVGCRCRFAGWIPPRDGRPPGKRWEGNRLDALPLGAGAGCSVE